MNRRYGVRLTRLESQVGPPATDLAAEAEQYGQLLWSRPGVRCYTHQGPDGARLALVGGQPLVYELLGVDVGDLS